MNRRRSRPFQRGATWYNVAAFAALAPITLGQAMVAAPSSVGDPDPEEEVTYARDVAPIFQENCQICHQAGAIAPMSLMTYEEVRPWAQIILQQVETQEMPPYHYDTDVGIQELQRDMRLSEEEIATISAWVAAGAPMGEESDLPPPVEWPDPAEWVLADEFGQPDVVIASDPFDVPATGQDIWRYPLVPTGISEDRCIRAIETKPSVAGRAVAHHANSNFRVPGEDGQLQGAGFLSEYALGKTGEIIPSDACRIAPAESWVAWDIHYYPNGVAIPGDQVEVGLWLYPEDFPQETLYRQTLRNYSLQGGDIDIPPHGTLMTQGFHTWDHPVRIDSFQPHGHLRLTGKTLEILYPETGRKEMISRVSNWNPGWHHSHIYQEHVAPLVPAGAVVILTALYDNTADNPHNPDPDQWVGVGDRAADEMSHAWLAITHLDQEGYDRIVAEREAMQRERDDEIADADDR